VNIPIIGQAPQQAPLIVEVNIEVGGPRGLVLDVVLLGVDHRQVIVSPQLAAQMMHGLGTGLDHIAPGSLEPFLQEWLSGIRRAKANGEVAMAQLGMGAQA